MVSEAPPPKRRFSGCISRPPLECKRSRGTYLDRRTQRLTERLTLRPSTYEFFQQIRTAFPVELFDEVVGRMSQTNSEIVVAEEQADVTGQSLRIPGWGK